MGEVNKLFLRLGETADYFGVPDSDIKRWIEHGHLKTEKMKGILYVTWQSIIDCKFRNEFPNLPNKDYFRPDEVAEYFSISKSVIYEWMSKGVIDSVKVGPGKNVRIKRETIVSMTQPNIQ